MEPLEQTPGVETNFSNPWNVSDLSIFLRYCCPECDFKCEEAHLFCDHAIDHHENSSTLLKYSLDEEQKTKSGQKVARKRSSDSGLNFHDLSEEGYNSNTELVDVIANNLKDDPEFDEKHDPLTIKSTNKCPDCDFKREETRLFCDHANDQHENSSALFKNQQYETCQTNLKQEICDNNHETFEVVQKFDNFDDFASKTIAGDCYHC